MWARRPVPVRAGDAASEDPTDEALASTDESGANEMSTPATRAAVTAKATLPGSRATSTRRGRLGATSATTWRDSAATPTPTSPASTASTSASAAPCEGGVQEGPGRQARRGARETRRPERKDALADAGGGAGGLRERDPLLQPGNCAKAERPPPVGRAESEDRPRVGLHAGQLVQ